MYNNKIFSAEGSFYNSPEDNKSIFWSFDHRETHENYI